MSEQQNLLKQQIDVNKNAILEGNEIEDFLKQEENVKLLGETLQNDPFKSEFKELFKSFLQNEVDRYLDNRNKLGLSGKNIFEIQNALASSKSLFRNQSRQENQSSLEKEIIFIKDKKPIIDLWKGIYGDDDKSIEEKINEIEIAFVILEQNSKARLDLELRAIPEEFKTTINLFLKSPTDQIIIDYYKVWFSSSPKIQIDQINKQINNAKYLISKQQAGYISDTEKTNFVENLFVCLLSGNNEGKKLFNELIAEFKKNINTNNTIKTINNLEKDITTKSETYEKNAETYYGQLETLQEQLVNINDQINKKANEISGWLVKVAENYASTPPISVAGGYFRGGTTTTPDYIKTDQAIENLLKARDKIIAEISNIQTNINKIDRKGVKSKQEAYYIKVYDLLLLRKAEPNTIRDHLMDAYYALSESTDRRLDFPEELLAGINTYFTDKILNDSTQKYKDFYYLIHPEKFTKLTNRGQLQGKEGIETDIILQTVSDNISKDKQKYIQQWIKQSDAYNAISTNTKSIGAILGDFQEMQGRLTPIGNNKSVNINVALKDKILPAAQKINSKRGELLSSVSKITKNKNTLENYYNSLVRIPNLDENGENLKKNLKALLDIANSFTGANGLNKFFVELQSKLESGSYSPETFGKRFIQEGVPMICAIGIAVAAIAALPATGGVSGMVLASLAGSIGGVVGQELGGIASTKRGQNYYGESFNNNGMLTRHINNQQIYNYDTQSYEGISHNQILSTYSSQIIVGAIQTFAFLGAGKAIGGYLNKMANSGQALNVVQTKLVNIVKKLPKMNPNVINIAEKKGIIQYLNKFGKEFGEEIFEEGTEQTAQKIHPWLGFVASIYNCLDGGELNYVIKQKNPGGADLKLTHSSFLGVGNTATSRFNYDASLQKEQVQAMLEKAYPTQEGYKVTEENGQLIVRQIFEIEKKHKDVSGKVFKQKESQTNEMIFLPSSLPHSVRTLLQNHQDTMKELYGFYSNGNKCRVNNLDAGDGKMNFKEYLQFQGFIITDETTDIIKVRKGNDVFDFGITNTLAQQAGDAYHQQIQENVKQQNATIQDEIVKHDNAINSDKLISLDNIINLEAKTNLEKFLRSKGVLKTGEMLSDEQVRKIYEVHTMEKNNPGENEFNLNVRKARQLRVMFDSQTTRVLMEGNVCGKRSPENIIKSLKKLAPSEAYVLDATGMSMTNSFDLGWAVIDTAAEALSGFDGVSTVAYGITKLAGVAELKLYQMQEKQQEKNQKELVESNSKLRDYQRWAKGLEYYSSFNLTSTQKEKIKEAIIKAHEVGRGQLGRNGMTPSMYNYTNKQLRDKMSILIDAGIGVDLDPKTAKDIAKKLLQDGVCGDSMSNENGVLNPSKETAVPAEVLDSEGKKTKEGEVASSPKTVLTEIQAIPTKEQDIRLSQELRNKIDQFKEKTEANKTNEIQIQPIGNITIDGGKEIQLMIINQSGNNLVVFLDKECKEGPPNRFPFTSNQILSNESKELLKQVVGYAGSLGGNFTGGSNFEAKSHYGQAIIESAIYQKKGLVGLARNVKEYMDGILRYEYSGQISNIIFLQKRGYSAKRTIDSNGELRNITPEQLEKINKHIKEYQDSPADQKKSKDINIGTLLGFTIEMEYKENKGKEEPTNELEMNVDIDLLAAQNNITNNSIVEALKITNEKFKYPYYDSYISKKLLTIIQNVDSRIITEICKKLPNKSVELNLFTWIEGAAKIGDYSKIKKALEKIEKFDGINDSIFGLMDILKVSKVLEPNEIVDIYKSIGTNKHVSDVIRNYFSGEKFDIIFDRLSKYKNQELIKFMEGLSSYLATPNEDFLNTALENELSTKYNISPEEMHFIGGYKGQSASIKRTFKEKKGLITDIIEGIVIDRTIQKFPPEEPGIFWRGVKISLEQFNAQSKDGIRKDSGLTGTTYLKDVAERYARGGLLMKIYGESGRSIEGLNVGLRGGEFKKTSEAEVLFPMGTKFKVMSIDYAAKPPVVVLKEITTKSTISPEIVKLNAALSPEARIAKAKELLGNLTSAQEQAILDAHNQPGKIYNLNRSQIRARNEILKKAGFTSEQARVLMENGICGLATKTIEQRMADDLEKIYNTVSGEIKNIMKSMENKFSDKTDLFRMYYDGYYEILENVDKKIITEIINKTIDGCLDINSFSRILHIAKYGDYIKIKDILKEGNITINSSNIHDISDILSLSKVLKENEILDVYNLRNSSNQISDVIGNYFSGNKFDILNDRLNGLDNKSLLDIFEAAGSGMPNVFIHDKLKLNELHTKYGIPIEELAFLSSYKGLSKSLKITFVEKRGRIKNIIETIIIDRILTKIPSEEPGVFWRGAGFDIGSFEKQCQNGIWIDKGLTSASFDKNIAENFGEKGFVMKIYGKTCRSIEGMHLRSRGTEEKFTYEQEVLFPINTKFEVIGIDRANNPPIVELKEI